MLNFAFRNAARMQQDPPERMKMLKLLAVPRHAAAVRWQNGRIGPAGANCTGLSSGLRAYTERERRVATDAPAAVVGGAG